MSFHINQNPKTKEYQVNFVVNGKSVFVTETYKRIQGCYTAIRSIMKWFKMTGEFVQNDIPKVSLTLKIPIKGKVTIFDAKPKKKYIPNYKK